MKWLTALLILLFAGAGVGWLLTSPERVSPDQLAGITPDLKLGEQVFYAGGCASCHAAPGAEGDDKLILAGGHSFPSQFGTFIAPNISSDKNAGIGGWSDEDLANAMLHGTSPEGQHYYPAFPYTSYAQMNVEDIVSLNAFLKTLPAVATPAPAHEVGFPFNIRRALGGWKLLFARSGWVVTGDLTPEQERGRYLVEGPGHCGECHTPRNGLGGLDLGKWLTGGPNPSGKGKIPALTPDQLDWSQGDIAEYLKSGFTPEYDSAGGEMVDVIANTSKLSDADRAAIAAYLKLPQLAAGDASD
ncbi:cytochrome c [Shimia biformata]|uniref:cytochrome c n=1 Tax=Shimia biformata TaxID=1294299 RepID=UPI00194FFDE1|nr:cytochrome c [Shimia biformata]